MFRNAAFGGGSKAALLAAKAPRCTICIRPRQARHVLKPVKHAVLRALSGLFVLGAVWAANVLKDFFQLLGAIDHATSFRFCAGFGVAGASVCLMTSNRLWMRWSAVFAIGMLHEFDLGASFRRGAFARVRPYRGNCDIGAVVAFFWQHVWKTVVPGFVRGMVAPEVAPEREGQSVVDKAWLAANGRLLFFANEYVFEATSTEFVAIEEEDASVFRNAAAEMRLERRKRLRTSRRELWVSRLALPQKFLFKRSAHSGGSGFKMHLVQIAPFQSISAKSWIWTSSFIGQSLCKRISYSCCIGVLDAFCMSSIGVL